MARMSDTAKNECIRQTYMQTKARRLGQDCRVFTVKVQANKLNAVQREFLKMAFVEAKWLYNHILSLSNEGTDIFTLKYTDIESVTHYDKDRNPIESRLAHLSSQMRQDVLQGVVTNIRNLAKAKAKGLDVGSLKYLSEYDSINLKQYGVSYSVVGGNRIRLQGLKKSVKVNGLEQLAGLGEYELANAKLLQRPSGWYVALTVYVPKMERQAKPRLGIDLGCETTLTTSDGRKYNCIVEEAKHLKALQRKLGRSQKGSNNAWKVRKAIRRCHERMCNRREDMARKICHELSAYDVVMQDEQLHGWHSNGHGRKVQHSALGRIKTRLEHTEGTVVLSKWVPTSKQCTACGCKHDGLRVGDRTFVCPRCGFTEDRDVHAARNMLWFYENIIGVERTEFTLDDFKERMALFFDGSTQEAAGSDQR